MLTIVAFIFGMGLLVAFHEFGHFYVGRRCGVKVIEVGFLERLRIIRFKKVSFCQK